MTDEVVVVLLISGAALELSGLALVAWDVVDARRQRAKFSRRNQLAQVGGIPSASRIGGVTVRGGVAPGEAPIPTIEDRVAQLERDVEAARKRVTTIEETAKRDRDSDLHAVSGWIAEVRRETFDLREELRPLIGRTVAGSIGRRGVGVALFAIGLVVQTIANVGAL